MHKHFTSIFTVLAMFMTTAAFAANHKIAMLDENSDGHIMLFDPPFLKANKGDTVTFVAKNPGHNIISRLVPKGVSEFKGDVSQNLTVSLDAEGIYIYECDLHVMLGMVGVIQVGKPVNLKDAEAMSKELKKKMAMSPERMDEYLSKIK